MTIIGVYTVDPDDLKVVMEAQALLKQLIEDRPVEVEEIGITHYVMPDGTGYDTNDANPADDLEEWINRAMFKGLDIECV